MKKANVASFSQQLSRSKASTDKQYTLGPRRGCSLWVGWSILKAGCGFSFQQLSIRFFTWRSARKHVVRQLLSICSKLFWMICQEAPVHCFPACDSQRRLPVTAMHLIMSCKAPGFRNLMGKGNKLQHQRQVLIHRLSGIKLVSLYNKLLSLRQGFAEMRPLFSEVSRM